MRKAHILFSTLVLLAVGSIGLLLYYPRVAGAKPPFLAARNVSPLSMTDVSPDADFGSHDTNSTDPGGRIVSLVIDPNNPLILYAASELAGVWKSLDGAHHWKPVSTGLRTNIPAQTNQALAIDSANSQRLLYATSNDDGRPNFPFAGLWVSDDAAGLWQHVDLPNCPQPSISSVIFASGQPFIATSCGIATTTDVTLGSATWTFLSKLPFTSNGAHLAAMGTSEVMFACSGPQVFRSPALGAQGSWTAAVSLIGNCLGLAVTPDNPLKAIVVHNTQVTTSIGVSLIDLDGPTSSQIASVGVQLQIDAICGWGSAVQGVFAGLRPRIPSGFGPGRSYDVFVSDGCHLFEFQLVSQTIGRWVPLTGTHVDTWAMAIPSTYNPDEGPCAAYLASDGGVFALPFPNAPAPDGCDPTSGWVRAMSGLHVMYSDTIAGVSRPQSQCPDANQPCPTLYLPTGDNDVWVSTQGGIPGNSWKLLGDNIGDAAIALVDPALPTKVLVARNAQMRDGKLQNYRVVTSPDANPPGAGASLVDITPPNAAPGGAPPGMANLVQVMTMPLEAPSQFGDYLAVQSPGGTADDVIVQNTSGNLSGWTDISPGQHFGPGQVGAVAASNGHQATVYYVLASPNDCAAGLSPPCGDYSRPPIFFQPGKVYKTEATNALSGPLWRQASNGLSKAYNLYADPYDARFVYVTDLGAQAIKSSSDGGKSWQIETDLTDIATNYGEFRFDCGAPAKMDGGGRTSVFAYGCGLQSMVFDQSHPEIRVAALWPGGVAFSRDAGKHWLPLDVTNSSYLSTELYQSVFSLFYDPQPNPTTKAASIYLALSGGSIKRVDGPFPSLTLGLVAICHTCLGSQIGNRSQIVAVVDTLDARLPLHQDRDGFYRGRLLFDSAKVSTLTYRLEIDGNPTASISHTISSLERDAGVLVLNVGKTRWGMSWVLWMLAALLVVYLVWVAYRSHWRRSS